MRLATITEGVFTWTFGWFCLTVHRVYPGLPPGLVNRLQFWSFFSFFWLGPPIVVGARELRRPLCLSSCGVLSPVAVVLGVAFFFSLAVLGGAL